MKSPLLHIIKKELITLTKDKIGMAFTLTIPVICIYVFNNIVSTDMNHIDVMAVVQKPSEKAIQYLQPLRNNDIFVFKGIASSIDDGIRQFRQSKIHALVVLGKDFDQQADAPQTAGNEENAAVQIITDNSNTIIGNTAKYYIQLALNPQHGDNISMKMLYNPGLYSMYHFGIGLYVFLLIYISIAAGASSMVKEKERHSIDAIIMSPISTWQLMFGKVLTSLIVNCIAGAIALAVSYYIIGVPIRGSIVLVALISLICIITTILLGTFISLSSATESNALSLVINVVCLPILYFSGVFFPIDSMPEWAQIVSECTYARWVIDALRKIMLQGVEFTYIIKELCLMLVSTFVFAVLCIYRLQNDRWLK